MGRNLMKGSLGEQCWGLAMFDDLIDLAKPESIRAYGQYLQQQMLRLQNTQDEWITQNIAFGVNVLENANALDQIENWGEWLTVQIKNPNGRSRCAIENCISALGILLEHRPNKIPPNSIFPFFINNMPITDDEEEIETSSATLLKIANQHADLIKSNAAQVIYVAVSHLGSGALTDDTAQNISKLIKILASENPNVLELAIAKMPQENALVAMTLLQIGNNASTAI